MVGFSLDRDRARTRSTWNAWYRNKWDSDPEWREKQREKNRRWRRTNIDKSRECNRKAHFKFSYGLTIEEISRMAEEQENKCAICKKECKLNVDHCHRTGAIRKLLCRNCNCSLGWYEKYSTEIQGYLY